MRRLGILATVLAMSSLVSLGACAELGMMTDGTSVSVGRPSRGFLLDGHKLPDRGEGFTTREPWVQRGNRYGTDELLDLLTGVGRRLATRPGPRLVVADLSCPGGGAARKWHHSHQSGRDVDLVYYMRDATGLPFEADAMRVFGPQGKARDGSGVTVDIPRTWILVKELISAHEATVQYIFMYEPLARLVLEHAIATHEPEAVVARARMTLKQPGDSAPHNDHMHVRVYCSERDKAFGCVDIGPMEIFAEREAERERDGDYAQVLATLVGEAAHHGAAEVIANLDAPAASDTPPVASAIESAGEPVHAAAGSSTGAAAVISTPRDLSSLGLLLRRSVDRMFLRQWH